VSPYIKQIPNILTVLRLILIPFFVLMLIDPSPLQIRIAGVLFIFAALTDYVDGLIARRLGAVSDFGKLLDPLADKILVASALIMMLALRSESDGSPWVPAPLVVLIIAREFWVTGIRAVAASRGVIVAANSGGKIKSGLQMVAIVLLLFQGMTLPLFGLRLPFEMLGRVLLGLSVVFSYWAAVEYTFEVFAEPEEEKNPVS
jgi:CDP-diacylglycerol--glycerol-3-phosphate 3-phosphatidyltransferase